MGEDEAPRVSEVRSPLVGVLIPAYNAAAFLPETLRSLQAQTHPNWCGVIVDDGSTDDTAAIADAFAADDERFVVVHQANGGEGAARNTAIAHLPPECQYVGFLDSDDLLLPAALATLLPVLEARPELAGASGLAEYIDADGRPIAPGVHPARLRHRLTYHRLRRRLLEPHEDASHASLLVLGTIWPPAVALVRRSAVDRTGGFDTSLKTLADWDFFLRASRMGPIAFVAEDIARYRRHPANASRNNALYIRNTCIVQRKAWGAAETTSDRLGVIRAQGHFLGWIAARNLSLGAAALKSRAPAAAGISAAWLALVASMAVLGPRSGLTERLLVRLVGLDRRVRGVAFLDEGP